MTDKVKSLGRQALEFTPQDRITLVEDVLNSLDRAMPEVDRLWAHEAAERLGAYRRGDLVAKGLGEIVAKYRP